ncbi:TP901-1 family phage major tail protein [Peribacillus sp. B2I2]|uniref:phage tail tube protein n=1 Tax=Peribacillus sp. B2I2 TaxID=3156468 RepID=UPI0035130B56
MAVKGVDILILVNGTIVGGQRGATLSESVETIETTHKLTSGFKEFEYGFGEWTVSADGVYIKGDAGYVALRDAMRNKQKVTLRIQEEGVNLEQGQALVTSRELEGAYDGEATYSVEFQGTGAITPVVA